MSKSNVLLLVYYGTTTTTTNVHLPVDLLALLLLLCQPASRVREDALSACFESLHRRPLEAPHRAMTPSVVPSVLAQVGQHEQIDAHTRRPARAAHAALVLVDQPHGARLLRPLPQHEERLRTRHTGMPHVS